MKKIICSLLIALHLIGCSTGGGVYKKDDATHGEFSLGRTALTILGVAAAVSAARRGGGGSEFQDHQDQGYAWDYLPGSGQWACRNKLNGQFANLENCENLAKVDNWP